MNKTATVCACQEGQVTVLITRDSACGEHCSTCKLCPAQNMRLTIPTTQVLQPGDTVLLECKTASVLLAAFFTYLFPLLLFLAGFALYGAMVGILCLLASLVPLSFLNRIYSKKMKITLRKLPE